MNDINKPFKVVANVGNLPLCSGVIAVPSGLKSHTFSVILAVFAPQPRLHQKGLIFVQFSTLLNKGQLQYSDKPLWQNKLEPR